MVPHPLPGSTRRKPPQMMLFTILEVSMASSWRASVSPPRFVARQSDSKTIDVAAAHDRSHSWQKAKWKAPGVIELDFPRRVLATATDTVAPTGRQPGWRPKFDG